MDNKENTDLYQDLFINLGFADKPTSNKDFAHEKFPSKIGGLPIMLFPIENKNYFTCEFCAGKLTFLLQLYSLIDSNPNAYHRTLYLFLCIKCFKIRPSFKCLRLQLPEKSEFYNSCKAKDLKQLVSYIPDLDTNNIFQPEFVIGIEDESPEALKTYTTFINQIHEGSVKDDFEELEQEPQLNKEENIIFNKLMKEVNNLEVTDDKDDDDDKDDILDNKDDKIKDPMAVLNNDVFFLLSSKIIRENPTQVIRYCRRDIKPLWYCKNNVMTNKNLKCNLCGKKKIFEFQVMPYIFLLYKQLINHDIGTIAIYTCDCDNQISEEYVYVQRTGEKIPDIDEKGKVICKGLLEFQNYIEAEEKLGFGASEEPDEDGFVEVKSKNKKKMQDIKEEEDDWENEN